MAVGSAPTRFAGRPEDVGCVDSPHFRRGVGFHGHLLHKLLPLTVQRQRRHRPRSGSQVSRAELSCNRRSRVTALSGKTNCDRLTHTSDGDSLHLPTRATHLDLGCRSRRCRCRPQACHCVARQCLWAAVTHLSQNLAPVTIPRFQAPNGHGQTLPTPKEMWR